MKKKIKIIFCLVLILFIAAAVPFAMAQLSFPHPFLDFSGIFVAFLPVCINGALVTVLVPVPIVVLFPYVPITPLVPVFKLWGPIPGAATAGSFLPGGLCLIPIPNPFGLKLFFPLPVLGTLVQIGTTLVPMPTYVPLAL